MQWSVQPDIDKNTHSLKEIAFSHSKIHDGDHYTSCKTFTHGSGDSPNILVVTPDDDAWAHFVFHVVSDDVMTVDFYEAPDYSGGSGMTAFNRNRNSGNTSGMILTSDASDDGSGKGTLIWTFKAGANKTVTATESERFEFILKQNEKYLLETAGANLDLITVLLDWYHNTDKS